MYTKAYMRIYAQVSDTLYRVTRYFTLAVIVPIHRIRCSTRAHAQHTHAHTQLIYYYLIFCYLRIINDRSYLDLKASKDLMFRIHDNKNDNNK